MKNSIDQKLYSQSLKVMPGGVNSPVRAFKAVGGDPVFIDSAKGQYLYGTDGRKYLDYIGSWGPCILGHAHEKVISAIRKAAEKGTTFGTATAGELELARDVIKLMRNIEMLRLTNSGTEATMTAIRLARAFTNRLKFIKFAGCYHGHANSFLVRAGSGAATFGEPTSPGVPPAVVHNTLVAEFNDIGSVSQLIATSPGSIAAVIVEPVVGNAGVIPPRAGFLGDLREITEKAGILLIFDEVMTGFRLAMGGAQELYGVKPDLTTLGKIIGGGMPIGAVGGQSDIMKLLAPAGPVYQAGTLSGNPLAVAAGRATLAELKPEIYERLETLAKQLETGVRENLRKRSLPLQYQRVGSMASLFFTDKPVRNFTDALRCDTAAFGRYFHNMLDSGIYLPPSQFEAFFVSAAHTPDDIDRTITANYEALGKLD